MNSDSGLNVNTFRLISGVIPNALIFFNWYRFAFLRGHDASSENHSAKNQRNTPTPSLRLHPESGLSIRQISASTKTSTGAIQKLLKQARGLNLTWPLPTDLDDAQLAIKFYPKNK